MARGAGSRGFAAALLRRICGMFFLLHVSTPAAALSSAPQMVAPELRLLAKVGPADASSGAKNGSLWPKEEHRQRQKRPSATSGISGPKEVEPRQSRNTPLSSFAQLAPESPIDTTWHESPVNIWHEALTENSVFVQPSLSWAHAIPKIIFGVACILISGSLQWFNEVRSAKMDTLLSRGKHECKCVSPEYVDTEMRGRLIHVQGKTRGAASIRDHQFQDAVVGGCLKLQSTVEVFEWAQTTRTWLDERKERRSQPRFHTEWTTVHQPSNKFKQPCPENPRMPHGLELGTFTEVCKRVELGVFVLTDDMVKSFRRFEPAMPMLPQTLTAHGMTFYANADDGFYYTRPGQATLGVPAHAPAGLFGEPKVGDVRIRFLCVPEGEATVVAVQCEKEPGTEGFVPYRPIPRAPCLSAYQERLNQIEEGERPLKEIQREISWSAGCCCCCNIIARCTKETVTEEIMYASDKLDPIEKPFEWVVPRNSLRVWSFRVASLAILWLGVHYVLQPFAHLLQRHLLSAFGNFVLLVVSVDITLVASASIMAAAYACYRPAVALGWFGMIVIVIAAPVIFGSLHIRGAL